MSNPEGVLLVQESKDQLFAAVGRLNDQIRAIKLSKKAANIAGSVTVNDILKSDSYYTYVAGSYKPFFLSSVGVYIKKQVAVGTGADSKQIDIDFDPANASFTGEIYVVVKFPQIDLSSLTRAPGATIGPVAGNGQIRYCKYPGIRLFEEVSLLISNREADRYTWENAIEYLEHECPLDKRAALERSIGQQPVYTGKFAYSLDSNAQPISGIQMWSTYTNGAQTPQNVQPPLTMVIPLLFTWCRDPQIPLSNFIMNPAQRSIRIKLANLNNIVSHYVGYPAAVLGDAFKLSEISVYTKSIYTNNEIAQLLNYQHKTIIRSWKTIRNLITNEGSGEINLREVTYPIEVAYVRAIPNENLIPPNSMANATITTYDNYYLPARIVRRSIPISFLGITPASAIFQNAMVYQADSYSPVIDGIGFQILETDFFSGAAPVQILEYADCFTESSSRLRYDGTTPHSSLIINFSRAFAGDLSRVINGYVDFGLFDAKYLRWDNSLVTSASPATFVISMRYLNFYEPKGEGLVQFHYSI